MTDAPLRLDPEFRDLLIKLADIVEERLGLGDCKIALGPHGRFERDGVFHYEAAIACDNAPQLVRAMRRAFPPRTDGRLRVTIGPFGDLQLEGACADDLRAAIARAQTMPQVNGD